MGKRNLTADQKMAIVLQGIKGEISIAELCRQHNISQTLYYNWRDRFIEGGKQRLNGKGENNPTIEYKTRIKELEHIIGKQTITIDILKKTQELLG
ncbi:MAG: transposase [Petrimonas sp.]|nr:transposase [Petrimonas sp.]